MSDATTSSVTGPRRGELRLLEIDRDDLRETLSRLLEIPSPSGYTDTAVHFVAERLERLGVHSELTRRGAIRADLGGRQSSPDRAVVTHLDTLGAMVTGLKENGRLSILPIGTWSSRFAAGARVTVFLDRGQVSGTILPLKASGHIFHQEVDSQPVSWDHVEIRVDEPSASRDDLLRLGIHVGDIVAIDPRPVFTDNGFINARHLDDKAGVAAVLAAAKAVLESGIELAVNCHLLFTIAEEVGSGASAVLHGDIAEMVTVDNAIVGPGQTSTESAVTIAMMDAVAPFDYHLTHKLLDLCRSYGLPHRRDVFRHYRSDAASAVEAGNDLRTALVGFGVDASHGWERTHLDGLVVTAQLIALYLQSPPTFRRDSEPLAPLEGFPVLPT